MLVHCLVLECHTHIKSFGYYFFGQGHMQDSDHREKKISHLVSLMQGNNYLHLWNITVPGRKLGFFLSCCILHLPPLPKQFHSPYLLILS